MKMNSLFLMSVFVIFVSFPRLGFSQDSDEQSDRRKDRRFHDKKGDERGQDRNKRIDRNKLDRIRAFLKKHPELKDRLIKKLRDKKIDKNHLKKRFKDHDSKKRRMKFKKHRDFGRKSGKKRGRVV